MPVRSDPLHGRITHRSLGILRTFYGHSKDARSSYVMYVPPLHFFATSRNTTFTSPDHFNLDRSSAGVYTSFHTSVETSGFLEGDALIFLRLQASGNVKSNVCMAATFQLMKRGSISSLHLSILFSASRAAPMRGAITGDVTPNNILLIGGYRGAQGDWRVILARYPSLYLLQSNWSEPVRWLSLTLAPFPSTASGTRHLSSASLAGC